MIVIANGQARWSAGRKTDGLVKKRDRKCGLQTEKQAGNVNLKTRKVDHRQKNRHISYANRQEKWSVVRKADRLGEPIDRKV
jgi:hypothetical protein